MINEKKGMERSKKGGKGGGMEGENKLEEERREG